jgi:hypothetical protein
MLSAVEVQQMFQNPAFNAEAVNRFFGERFFQDYLRLKELENSGNLGGTSSPASLPAPVNQGVQADGSLAFELPDQARWFIFRDDGHAFSGFSDGSIELAAGFLPAGQYKISYSLGEQYSPELDFDVN